MSKQRLVQKQYQNLSPRQIQFLGLLQIPVVRLEKRIEEEIENNPVIEEEEESEVNQYYSQKNYNEKGFEEYQIEAKSESLEDYLINQIVDLNLDDEISFLIKYLINSLDNNGFLNRDLYSISSDLITSYNKDYSEDKLGKALDLLKTFEPIGIGTRNLQECLIVQLKKVYPLEINALTIISDYYSSFSNKNFEYLIKTLKISEKKLRDIYFLIEKLQPIPSSGFTKQESPLKYIYADFTVTTNDNKIQLYVNKGNIKQIKVSKYYSNLLNETKDSKTKEFLAKKVDQAKWFQESIVKRENTLKKVMNAIIGIQKEFFISGSENDLKPMKLADVSDLVNMDISTISRVSNSKYIEAPFGTFKVKELFSEAYRKDSGEIISTNEIKNQLKEIILIEDKLNPFTDEQLTAELGKHEYHIARRTVAKYREKLNIKTAKLRREI